MVMLFIVVGFLAIVTLVAAAILLGFWLGAPERDYELLRIRLQAAEAARRMHDLTREAFVAMAEHVERRRS
jgi:hypothetical protein